MSLLVTATVGSDHVHIQQKVESEYDIQLDTHAVLLQDMCMAMNTGARIECTNPTILQLMLHRYFTGPTELLHLLVCWMTMCCILSSKLLLEMVALILQLLRLLHRLYLHTYSLALHHNYGRVAKASHAVCTQTAVLRGVSPRLVLCLRPLLQTLPSPSPPVGQLDWS